VRATSDKFESLGAAKLTSSSVQALPALANGRFYIRDEQSLRCFRLQ
jgi:hypothetical protein